MRTFTATEGWPALRARWAAHLGEADLAAVLHDLVEDTACTLDEVRDHFGDRVTILVDRVTKPPRRDGRSREEERVAYQDPLGRDGGGR